MTINDIITLTKAGFSKDEIIKLGAAEPATADPKDEKKQPEPEEGGAKPEDASDISDIISEKVDQALAPFEQLFDKMAEKIGLGPSIDNVEPKGIEDIIADFFK